MPTTPKASTMAALLCSQAHARGSASVYTYLADGHDETRSLTFVELYLHASAVAARLQRSLDPGDRALIMADDPIEFIRAFMGCQLAGVIAVPAARPFPTYGGKRIATLQAIAANCGARAILTGNSADFRERVVDVAPGLGALEWIAVEQVDEELAAEFRARRVHAHDVSFLQYTSGSTSTPKGVVVTHDALMHNQELLYRSFSYGRDDVVASWLPLFHDMGLIGTVFPALYTGIQTVMMPPLVFVQQPARWLRTITRYGATVSGSADFGYAMCARRIAPEEREGLDLSSWRLAFSGAEPVRAATLDAFSEAFGPYGFDRRSWFPCYGLAECTLMATGGEPGTGAKRLAVQSGALREGLVAQGGEQTLIGCGMERLHRRVEIVDPVTRRRSGPGVVGEIWLAGPDVCAGYWERPEESNETFGARLTDSGDGPFLRTGDLGFMHDGELYVTGRLKDVLIVGGRNHYPQDLETTVEASHDAIQSGGCVAFALERDGREQVVVVAELQPARARVGVRLADLARGVRAAVSARHGITVDEVMLVERKSVPKTTSGKLQRAACRAAFERGELQPVQEPAVGDLQGVG
jgi:acyl-CoA synthetase (AMP-forming)/AMP-acid ligase II